MKLWLLVRVSSIPEYEVTNRVVVRASTSVQAREIAASVAGEEGEAIWTNPETSTCTLVTQEGLAGVICRSFNAA